MINRIKRIRERIRCFCWKAACVQLEGVGIIEIILILVIIIGLVLIFRKQIEAIIQTAFDSINTDATGINEEITID